MPLSKPCNMGVRQWLIPWAALATAAGCLAHSEPPIKCPASNACSALQGYCRLAQP
jgi:hypothetical protein